MLWGRAALTEAKQQDLTMKQVKCPTCGTLASYAGNPDRPFCSERCRLLDLGQWADEGYRIAGKPAPQQQNDHESGD